jgi:hypothetical protein
MPKSGKHLLATGGERSEPLVTYTRLSPDDDSVGPTGRVEPHFTAVRVDRRGRPIAAGRGDGFDTLPLVEAPRSDASIDPMAEVSAGEIRDVRSRRGPRVALLAGVIALVAGAGVLAAAYNGIANFGGEALPLAAIEPANEPIALAAVEPEAVDATGRTVRVVSADQIPSADPVPATTPSQTAALAPRAAADPAAGGAAPSGQATASGEAALSAEPPGRVIADPPPPRLRPISASFSPPQPATPQAEAMATFDPGAAWPATTAPAATGGSDVDSALASVDRILSSQQFPPVTDDPGGDYLGGSGDDEFYGPVAPIVQPLPYPVLQPVPNAVQGYPSAAPNYPGGEPYGPYYPGQEPYAAQQAYPGAPQPLYGAPQPLGPGVDLAAEEPPPSNRPWWLPQRRALVVPNAPVPPAAVPNGGAW